jgi:signal peptidase II
MSDSRHEVRPPSSMLRWTIVGGAVAIVLVADQLSKAWALDALADGRVIEVAWTLQFNLAFNTGMAFSQGAGGGQIIGVVATLITVLLAWFATKVESRAQLFLIGAVIGGALGNVVDRLTRVGEIGSTDGGGFMSGGVVDFIDLQWWPIFNIADAAVVAGGILLALLVARSPEGDDTTGSDGAAWSDEAARSDDAAGSDEGSAGAPLVGEPGDDRGSDG